jgi:hemerythrin
MDSTVIGDAVNLAARLEEATKTYNTPIIISHNTLYDLNDPNEYQIRFLDRIRVKGKSQPLSVYEVFDNDPEELRTLKEETRNVFEQAVAYYHLKDITKAIQSFKRCIEICPNDLCAHIYLKRCYEFEATSYHHGTGELDLPQSWKEEFKSGIPELDAAHQSLLERINQHATRIRQNENDDFHDVYAFLKQYCETLFPQEEAQMREHDYPFAESHTQEHKRFIEHYLDLEKRMHAGKEDSRYLAYRTELLLLDWFASHATRADRHFARHLHQNNGQ